eukprot:m.219691 g.219691  ORF g.219691 m.219691 type:complete len:68 (+) comp22266_c0_seq23:560-763(+)
MQTTTMAESRLLFFSTLKMEVESNIPVPCACHALDFDKRGTLLATIVSALLCRCEDQRGSACMACPR